MSEPATGSSPGREHVRSRTRAGSGDVVREVLPALRACAAAIEADLAARS